VLKVITGRLKPAQAHQEFINADTALLGTTVAQKQKLPIKEVVKQTFGKVGAGIKHIVQKAVQTFAPQAVRTAIKTGIQRVGQAVASGVRTVVKLGTKVASGIKSVGKAVVGFVGRLLGRK
jgi:ribosomal protein S20